MRQRGPRTTQGQAIVARNAIRRGVCAAAPVIPGVERVQDWETTWPTGEKCKTNLATQPLPRPARRAGVAQGRPQERPCIYSQQGHTPPTTTSPTRAPRGDGRAHARRAIEPGKPADLVVLGADLLCIPPEDIREVPVALTVVGGRVVHDGSGAALPPALALSTPAQTAVLACCEGEHA